MEKVFPLQTSFFSRTKLKSKKLLLRISPKKDLSTQMTSKVVVISSKTPKEKNQFLTNISANALDMAKAFEYGNKSR